MRSKVQTLSIDEVRACFEAWRQNRQGREPIPDELWSAAIELARENGINQTAAELHLDGGKLKRLMAEKVTSGKSAPAFVELLTPRAVSLPECTIKLEGRRGKVRIQLKGADFTGAKKVAVAHGKLKSGDPCPGCCEGKVYRQKEPKALDRSFDDRFHAQLTADLVQRLLRALVAHGGGSRDHLD